jgi:peptide/nickel transport system permease protein
MSLRVRSGHRGAQGFGLGLIVLWVVLAASADLVAPFDPLAQQVRQTLQPPGLSHWLGTDDYGRDVLSRIIFSARLDLGLGLLGVVSPFVIGYAVGTVSAYAGGLLDFLLRLLMDVFAGFPFIVLALAIIAVAGPGLHGFFIAVALAGWARYARLVRDETIALRQSAFVAAARGLGLGRFRIVTLHVLPNSLVPAVKLAAADIVRLLLLVCALGYLGLVAPPPTAEWGLMIAEGQTFLESAWWISLFPGLAFVLLTLGFSLATAELRRNVASEP